MFKSIKYYYKRDKPKKKIKFWKRISSFHY